MSRNEWYFEFISNIKYLNCVKTFTCISHTTFTIHVSNLVAIDLLLFIKSQLTTNAQKVLALNQCKYGNIWSLLHRSRGECQCFDRHKYWLDKSLLFSSELNMLGFFSVPTDKKNCLNVNGLRLESSADIIWYELYIHGSVHRDSILIRSNEIQQYAGVY